MTEQHHHTHCKLWVVLIPCLWAQWPNSLVKAGDPPTIGERPDYFNRLIYNKLHYILLPL